MEQNIVISKGYKIRVFVVALLVLLVSVAGVSYAYFSIQVTGNEQASSVRVQAAVLRLVYTDTLVMEGRNVYPGWAQTKTISVENTGTVKVKYEIVWRDLLNEITNNELLISATCVSNIQGNTCNDIPLNPIPMATSLKSNVYVDGGIDIDPGETHTYTVIVTFPEMSTNQNYNQGKTFRGTLNIRDGVPIVMNPSSFTYSVSNNEATITGYNGVILAYDVYDVDTCISAGSELLENEQEMNEENATYVATELCNGREVYGTTLGKFLEEQYTIPWILYDFGIKVYRVDDITEIIDKNTCKSNGALLLMLAYSMDETSATYMANELCEGREADGMTLQSAIESGTVDSEYYETLGAPNIFLGKIGNIIIPSEIDGYTVTSIGNGAFYHNYITGAVLPDTLKTIEAGAFERTDLSTIALPKGVTSIGDYAFFESSLVSVSLPNSVTSIGNYAFASNRLTSINIPDSIHALNNNVFAYNQLSSVIIPNAIYSIGSGAFEGNQLTSIVIPSSVHSIGDNAFYSYNDQLTSVIIQGKSSSNDFDYYGDNIWGWNFDESTIVWEGSS